MESLLPSAERRNAERLSFLGGTVATVGAIALLAMACAPGPQRAVPSGSQGGSQPQASAPAPAPGPTQEERPLSPPVKVKVGIVATTTDAGLFIALEKGYLEKEGLQPEAVTFQTAAQMIAPLATGELDVGSGAPSAGLTNALNRDISVKIVADKYQAAAGHASNALVIRKDLLDSGQFKDYADLRGLNIGVATASGTPGTALAKAMGRAGLTIKDANVIELPFPDMNPAFANKGLDAAIHAEPFVAVGVDQGLIVRWKGVDEIYPNQQVSVLMYSPNFAEKSPEAARRFMVAYLKGARDYNDAMLNRRGRREVVDIMAKYTAVKDPAMYEKIVWAAINPNGEINNRSLEEDQDWYLANGYIQKKADLKDIIDMRFVEYALARLGRYQ